MIKKIEGFSDSGPALAAMRFRNLPWWQTSVWLPVTFQPPQDPAIDQAGWPVFLGSLPGLLAELDEVRKLSDLALGTTPVGYHEMRRDTATWLRSGFEPGDERAIIQWVWRGLHDAADAAVQAGAPLMLDLT